MADLQGYVDIVLKKCEYLDLTQNEELLMALAIFLKQQGFGEMLLSEFHKIALNNSTMFKDEENKKRK